MFRRIDEPATQRDLAASSPLRRASGLPRRRLNEAVVAGQPDWARVLAGMGPGRFMEECGFSLKAWLVLIWLLVFNVLPACGAVPYFPARVPFKDAWKEELLKQPIRAFCLDFNLQILSRNFVFEYAPPGHWADVDPAAHVDWYKEFGANCIQTFVLSCNGYAWYKGGPIPEQPGLQHDFLTELAQLAHQKRMLVFGYYPLDVNILYGEQHPDERYYQSVYAGIPKAYHIPYTTNYIDYICASVADVLKRTEIDGLLLDQVFNVSGYVSGEWLECEQAMYREILGKPFPGAENLSASEIADFRRWSADRLLYRLCSTIRRAKPDCLIWINGMDWAYEFPKADWYLNEPMDLSQITEARYRLAGLPHRYLQTMVGWASHDPRIVIANTNNLGMDFYGFMELVNGSMPPPVSDFLTRPVEFFTGTDYLSVSDRNLAALARIYQGKPLKYVMPIPLLDRVRKSTVPIQAWNSLGELVANLDQGQPYPETLAATGVFADLAELTPLGGVAEYEMNLPTRSKGAINRFWFAIPDPSKMIDFQATNAWGLPRDAVWIQHLEMDTGNGSAAPKRRLETRFLVLTTNATHAFTYRWDETQTNAFLVVSGGEHETISVQDGESTHQLNWQYPSRSECLHCHGSSQEVLGFNTAQLNRDHQYRTVVTNQLYALNQAGYFSSAVPTPRELPALAAPTNSAASVAYRVRCYLDVNCSECHNSADSTTGFWDARRRTPLAQAGILNGALQNPRANSDQRIVVPGSLDQSDLLARLASMGSDHMPPQDDGLVDQSAVDLLHEWITNRLAQYRPTATSFSQWQIDHFKSPTSSVAAKYADADGDGLPNFWEWQFDLDPNDPSEHERWSLHLELVPDGFQLWVPNVPNHGVEFALESATNGFGPWTPIKLLNYTNVFSPMGNTILLLSNTPPSTTFYRLQLFEPY
jgi:hypothetical protein